MFNNILSQYDRIPQIPYPITNNYEKMYNN